MPDFKSLVHGLLVSNFWLVRHFADFRRHLRGRHGLVDVIPLARARWHRGSRYFRAHDAEGRPLFVKTDGHHRLLANEIGAWETLRQRLASPTRFAPVRQHELDGPHPFAAFDWIYARPLAQLAPLPPAGLALLADELRLLLNDLEAAGIIHRDISPDNLLVTMEGGTIERVTMIDFAFAARDHVAASDDRLPERELKDLAFGFKPATLRWDDAYACDLILRRLLPPDAPTVPALDAITRRIGHRAFEHRLGASALPRTA